MGKIHSIDGDTILHCSPIDLQLNSKAEDLKKYYYSYDKLLKKYEHNNLNFEVYNIKQLLIQKLPLFF